MQNDCKLNPSVVPVNLAGHNSRLFQLASSVHSNPHFALLIKEFKIHIDEPVQVAILGGRFYQRI
ncbi:MAG: hypothetical protein ABR89_10860 [Rhodobacter sp. BACL10 MAG-120910-bin24]|nr:MAG: hypothetical protein ABR89_10860 [Rhodobacter sp. BACL10 MAG-120910-bin24]KRP25636.1 MAG: hypothetical protein ABR97_09895 [Rhodobacter sp. BACL10 MAG-120419-bin15]